MVAIHDTDAHRRRAPGDSPGVPFVGGEVDQTDVDKRIETYKGRHSVSHKDADRISTRTVPGGEDPVECESSAAGNLACTLHDQRLNIALIAAERVYDRVQAVLGTKESGATGAQFRASVLKSCIRLAFRQQVRYSQAAKSTRSRRKKSILPP